MATVHELNTSRRYLNNESQPRAEREYMVLDADSEADVVALFGSTLPGQYENYPNDSGLPYDMLAFDYSIVHEPNRVGAWRVTMRYKAKKEFGSGATNPTSADLTPDQVGYRTARLSMRAEFRDQWRSNPTATTASNNDIGGSPLDIGGIPLSALVHQQEITIIITDSFLPTASAISAALGTRNASTFLRYAAGSIVFRGCNVETIPEVARNSIEYNFVYDINFHMIQYPVRGNNASPILGTSGTYLNAAAKVLYRQPFPNTSNFNNISIYFGGL